MYAPRYHWFYGISRNTFFLIRIHFQSILCHNFLHSEKRNVFFAFLWLISDDFLNSTCFIIWIFINLLVGMWRFSICLLLQESLIFWAKDQRYHDQLKLFKCGHSIEASCYTWRNCDYDLSFTLKNLIQISSLISIFWR